MNYNPEDDFMNTIDEEIKQDEIHIKILKNRIEEIESHINLYKNLKRAVINMEYNDVELKMQKKIHKSIIISYIIYFKRIYSRDEKQEKIRKIQHNFNLNRKIIQYCQYYNLDINSYSRYDENYDSYIRNEHKYLKFLDKNNNL